MSRVRSPRRGPFLAFFGGLLRASDGGGQTASNPLGGGHRLGLPSRDIWVSSAVGSTVGREMLEHRLDRSDHQRDWVRIARGLDGETLA